MSNTILIKRGSGTPTTSNTSAYELAYDYTNDKLYIHDGASSSMVEIGGGGASTSGSNNQILTDDGSGGINSESSLTFDGDFKVTGTGGSTFETVDFDGSNGYLMLSGTASQRIEFRNTSNNANGWIGVPSWNTDAFYAYLPTASGNELGYIFESSRHNFYRGVTINNGQDDYDFIVKGDSNSNLIFADASTDRVGIGTASPSALLDVVGTGYIRTAVFSDAFKPYSGTLATYGSSSSTDHYFVGDVGIGISSPTEELDVNGVGKFRGNSQGSDVLELGQQTGYSGSENTQLYTISTYDNAGGVANVGDHLQIQSVRWGQDITFARNGQGGAVPTARFYNGSSSGYMELYKALNPTTDATYQANVKLNVNGDSFFRGGSVTIGDVSPLTTGGTPRLSLRGAGLNIGAGTNDMSYIRRIDTGDYQWQTWNGANDGELHLQPYGGKVGIGTNTPDAKLEVNGSTNSDLFSLEGAGSSFKLIAESGSTGSANIMAYRLGLRYGSNDNGFIDFYRGPDGATGYLAFGASGSEAMRLDRYGKLGVGTASPQKKLHVSTGNTDIAARFENTTTNGTVMELLASGDSTTMYFQTDHIYSSANLYLGAGNRITHYRGSDHRFQYGSSNTEAMRVDSAGNLKLGSGTVSLSYASHGMEIAGSGNQSLRLEADGSTVFEISARTSDVLLYNNGTARSIRFGVGGGEKFRINSDGNTYVYETLIINTNNESLLGRDTGGTVRNLIKLDSSNRVLIGDANTAGVHHHYPSTYSQINTDHGYLQIGAQNGSHCHYTTDRANHWFNQMIYVNGGVVSSYNSNLSLRRNGATSDSISIEDNAIKVNTDSANERFRFGSVNRSFTNFVCGPINNNSKAYIRANNGYSTATTPDYTWWYNDQCGIYHPAGNTIGFSASGEKVKIGTYGLYSASSVYVAHGGSDYTPNISFLGGSNTPGSNAYENAGIGYYDNSGTGSMKFFGNRGTMSWFFTDSDETLFNMASDGTFHAEADVVAYSQSTNSDRRLKEDINPIQYGLKEVLEINPVKYKWIEKRGGKKDIGVIAQDIEKIIPEIVQENKALNSDEMIKSVDYGKMVAVLIKAVQEQQEQINELKEKLNG